jgi:hypothetical protein
MTARRFPAPWSVEEQPACFMIAMMATIRVRWRTTSGIAIFNQLLATQH